MNAYLLTWNPKKYLWTDYHIYQQSVELGFSTDMDWSCGVRKHMPIGSRVFMMRVGHHQPIHGIFASGITTSEPFSDYHWNDGAQTTNAQYIEFKLDAMLNFEVHKLLKPEIEVSNEFNWRPQVSGIQIPSEIAEPLEQKWLQHLATLKLQLARDDEFTEGKGRKITVTRYERDPSARQACINHYQAKCIVCGFSFQEVYGDLGSGFIEVHHLRPMSDNNGEHTVDPIQDLRPVCPNCHAMLHRETPPLTIKQLQEHMERAKKSG